MSTEFVSTVDLLNKEIIHLSLWLFGATFPIYNIAGNIVTVVQSHCRPRYLIIAQLNVVVDAVTSMSYHTLTM